MSKNNNTMIAAKVNKKDEFYTKIETIDAELSNYKHHFEGKTVFCNCDDPRWSNFTKYFAKNFDHLGLKKLISTGYDENGNAELLYMTGDTDGDGQYTLNDLIPKPLGGKGDFRSPESVELLKEADIVVTNPPFSLFREYIDLLIEHNKKFIILGNNNAITYKNIFNYIKQNKLWLGVNSNKYVEFILPDGYKPQRVDENGVGYGKVPAISWFTNLDHKVRNEELLLYRNYNSTDYPKYDHYNAINVDKVNDIPLDYNGVMGVPITFLGKYNPEQFEVLDANEFRVDAPKKSHGLIKDKHGAINGVNKYARVLIRRK